jgi:hypothetical protein
VYTHWRHTRTVPIARKPPDWLTLVSFNDGSSLAWGDSETRTGVRNDTGRRRLWPILSYFPATWVKGVRKKNEISRPTQPRKTFVIFGMCEQMSEKISQCQSSYKSIDWYSSCFIRTDERTDQYYRGPLQDCNHSYGVPIRGGHNEAQF